MQPCLANAHIDQTCYAWLSVLLIATATHTFRAGSVHVETAYVGRLTKESMPAVCSSSRSVVLKTGYSHVLQRQTQLGMSKPMARINSAGHQPKRTQYQHISVILISMIVISMITISVSKQEHRRMPYALEFCQREAKWRVRLPHNAGFRRGNRSKVNDCKDVDTTDALESIPLLYAITNFMMLPVPTTCCY